MPRSPVDQEDFQAWLDHPVTRWARLRFRLEATAVAEAQRDHLLNSSPALTPPQWAELQAQSARLLGRCSGLMEFADLSYDAIREETDDEIKEMESKSDGV